MRSLRKQLLATVFAALVCGGCTEVFACPDDLQYRQEPQQASLAVDETLVPTVEFRGCGGTKHLDDTITWSTDTPGVVSVNAITGLVRALKPGSAMVIATGARYGAMPGIAITVQ